MKQKKYTEDKQNNSGITLIALAVTIIIMLLLAGISIQALRGNNGILTQSNKVRIMTELSGYKEELDLYKLSKKMEDVNFSYDSLTAGKYNLFYNTQETGEPGNIKTIIPNLSSDYLEKMEIIKGELILYSVDEELMELAKSLDIKINPYNIVNGELVSSVENLLLVDNSGTLTVPDSVKKIGEGAFSNIEGLRKIVISRHC